MKEWTSHSNAALHSHNASKQQGTQTKKRHTNAEKPTKNLPGVEAFPLFVQGIHIKSQRAIYKMTQEVSHHQSTCKKQERKSFGLPTTESLVGFEKDEESHSIGDDPYCHAYDRRGDRDVFCITATIRPSARVQAFCFSSPIVRHDWASKPATQIKAAVEEYVQNMLVWLYLWPQLLNNHKWFLQHGSQWSFLLFFFFKSQLKLTTVKKRNQGLSVFQHSDAPRGLRMKS